VCVNPKESKAGIAQLFISCFISFFQNMKNEEMSTVVVMNLVSFLKCQLFKLRFGEDFQIHSMNKLAAF